MRSSGPRDGAAKLRALDLNRLSARAQGQHVLEHAVYSHTNAIVTAKYTPLSFVPKVLLQQFSRLGNVYFLVISALQQVPGWSSTGRRAESAALRVRIGK